MLEHYRTMRAMLALGEFSVAELAELSGVQQSTVRTTLRRSSDYVERTGTTPSGRRGGQPVRWRLRPEARHILRKRLHELELGVGAGVGDRAPRDHTLPPGVIEAEDVLLRLAPREPSRAKRARLVKLARAQLGAAQTTAPSRNEEFRERADLHRQVVQLLIDLEEAESSGDGPESPRVLERRNKLIFDLLIAAGRIDEKPLTDAIRHRLTSKRPSMPPEQCVVAGFELVPHQMIGVLINGYGEELVSRPLQLKSMDVPIVISGATTLLGELKAEIQSRGIPDEIGATGFQLGAPVDPETGTVLFYHKAPPAPPGPVREIDWLGPQPFGQMLEEATGTPVVMGNDANAYATFEKWFGVGNEVSRFAVVLIREGVGGSLVFDSELFDGPMEIGNLSVFPEKGRKCDCGNPGCLETTGGIHGIVSNFVQTLMAKNMSTLSLEDVPSLENLQVVARLAEHDDSDIKEAAEAAFRDAGYAIAKGIGIIINIARPQAVVLYAPEVMIDSNSSAGSNFLSEAKKYGSYCHTVFDDTRLILRPLHVSDGARGAALLALEHRIGVTPGGAVAVTPGGAVAGLELGR